MNRRQLAVGAAAGVGLAAGGGFAIWGRPPAGSPIVPAEIDLWALTFETPAGAPIVMSALAGKPLLLNFWATWCAPCVTEMPMLDAFARAQRANGIQVLALAIDQPEAVRRFITERAIGMPVALGGATGLDLSRSLGNTAGALPFSASFASNGTMVDKKLGRLDEAGLSVWATRMK